MFIHSAFAACVVSAEKGKIPLKHNWTLLVSVHLHTHNPVFVNWYIIYELNLLQRSCASQFHASLYEGLVVPWWSSILSRACSLLRILFLDMRQCYLMEFELPLTYIFQPLQNKQEQSSTQENYGIDRVWKIRHNVAADLSGGRIMMLKKLKFKSLIRLKKRRRRFHLMLLLAQ